LLYFFSMVKGQNMNWDV